VAIRRAAIEPTDMASGSFGRIDPAVVDATTEEDIATQIAEDADDSVKTSAENGERHCEDLV